MMNTSLNILKTIILLSIYLLCRPASGQNYNMSNAPITTCSGNWYDDGGPSGNYNDFVSYTQTFTSPNGNTLKFTFTTFFTSWITDQLHIYDGPNDTYPLIGSYGSNNSPGTISSNGTSLTFKFVPNAGGSSWTGWAATISCGAPPLVPYNMTNGTTVTSCTGLFYDDGGLSSPYTHNQDKVMTFCSGNSDMLEFSFNNAGTAFESGDTLLVYDGPSTSSPLIAKYIKASILEKIQSSGTCLTFQFKSDGSASAAGWQASFQCVSTPPASTNYSMNAGIRYVCSGTFTDDGGPSGDYNDYTSRLQTFYSFNGKRLIADFTAFNTYLTTDILYIYDGPNSSYPLIGSYSSNVSPGTIQSTGTSLTFAFVPNGNNYASSGWSANLSCGTDPLNIYKHAIAFVNASEGIYTDDGGLTSNYSDNQNQFMSFCAASGSMLEFTFNNIATSFSAGDSLFVYDGSSVSSPLIAVHVAGTYAEKIQSTGSCIMFRFKSDGIWNSTGWMATFKSVTTPAAAPVFSMSAGIRYTCSGTFVDDGGPNGNYNDYASHVQTFVSNSGCGLKVTFNQFTTSTSADYLKAYDGMNTNAPLLGTFAINATGQSVQSTGSAITFEFVTNSLNSSTAGWTATLECPITTPAPSSSSNGPICVGSDIVLQASSLNNASYLWSGPNGFSSLTQNPVITQASVLDSGYYKVRAWIGTCASVTDSVLVEVNSSPSISISSNAPFCIGNQLNLAATSIAGAQYSWTGPDGFVASTSNTSITTNNSSAGIYEVVVTKGACTVSANTTVQLYNLPVKPIITNAPSGDLTSSSANSYEWYLDGVLQLAFQTQQITPTQSGSYSVRVYNAEGCSALSDAFAVVLNNVNDRSTERAIQYYPNPFSSNITIKMEGLSTHVRVLDSKGQEIHHSRHVNETVVLDLSSHVDGIYHIVVLEENQEPYTFTVVKQ